MKPQEAPKSALAIIIFSVLWMIIVFWQWGYNSPDVSQLIFGVLFGLGGIFVAYVQWYHKQMDDKYKEIVQMCDSFLKFKLEVQEEKCTQKNQD